MRARPMAAGMLKRDSVKNTHLQLSGPATRPATLPAKIGAMTRPTISKVP